MAHGGLVTLANLAAACEINHINLHVLNVERLAKDSLHVYFVP